MEGSQSGRMNPRYEVFRRLPARLCDFPAVRSRRSPGLFPSPRDFKGKSWANVQFDTNLDNARPHAASPILCSPYGLHNAMVVAVYARLLGTRMTEAPASESQTG
jgi:hypothetical protein